MGISRACASKWVNRWRQHSDLGLHDRSSTPRASPHATPAQVIEHIQSWRREHKWSARRIMRIEHLDLDVPGSEVINIRQPGLQRRRRDRCQGHRDASAPPKPCLTRIAADLRGAIDSGILLPGAPLPSVKELAARYKIAPSTAHRGLALLADAGLITGKSGRRKTVVDRAGEPPH
jgi:hypothetical protein